MMHWFVCTGLALALGATSAMAGSVKEGTPGVPLDPGLVSPRMSDFVYNTGGFEGFVPDLGGSGSGWGEWFITTIFNNTGQDIILKELAFPCCGPATEPYGWLVWLGMGGIVPPAGDAYSAMYHGAFTPLDPDPATFPPTVYTPIDISASNILVPSGTYFCVGYDVTGNGGQTTFNGVQTWAWYGGFWDPDQGWGRTAIIQVKADFGVIETDRTTWSEIKALYQ